MIKICITFVPDSETNYMVDVAQSVRVTDCGSEGRGFESHLPPLKAGCEVLPRIFFCLFCPVSELPSNKQKTMSFAPPAFRSAIWEMVGLPQSSISAPRKRDCGTPSVMLRIAQHSNPIFHPKFESLASQGFFIYIAVQTCLRTAI